MNTMNTITVTEDDLICAIQAWDDAKTGAQLKATTKMIEAIRHALPNGTELCWKHKAYGF